MHKIFALFLLITSATLYAQDVIRPTQCYPEECFQETFCYNPCDPNPPAVVYEVPYTCYQTKCVTTCEEESYPVYIRKCHCRMVPRYYTVVQRRFVPEYYYTVECRHKTRPHRERFLTQEPYTTYKYECYYDPKDYCQEP